MLKSASESITLERLKAITASDHGRKPEDKSDNEEVFWRFSAKELSLMPKTFRKEFRTQGCIAHVRKRRSGKNGWNYEIRYRRNDTTLRHLQITLTRQSINLLKCLAAQKSV